MRLLPASKEILRVLTVCPWIPVDVLAAFTGARSRVSVYQALARLTAAGLVQKRQAWAGASGTRQTALWATAQPSQNRRLAHRLNSSLTNSHSEVLWRIDSRPGRARSRVDDALRLAAVRALAGWFLAQRANGQSVKIEDWQAPFRWTVPSGATRPLSVSAAALVRFTDGTGVHDGLVVIVPDLGTAPIARLRPTLRWLFKLIADTEVHDGLSSVRLLIVTTNSDGAGARRSAWLRLVQRLETETGASPSVTEILEWPQVYRLLRVHAAPAGGAGRARAGRRGHRADEMLELLGRHPLLTIRQLSDLLGLTSRRAHQVRKSLERQRLVLRLPASELGPHAPVPLTSDGWVMNDFAELTAAGRQRVAHALGLTVAAARRHHGLFGGTTRDRNRALRQLAHTIGANEIFVALAVGARGARTRGADEALEEWRPAAACEHWRCKPDGYGCYRRGDDRFGFFLEYDRGTERAAQYDAKLAAYYRFKNSQQGAHDYIGFPLILVVSTSPTAEHRLIRAGERARARFGEDLPLWTTTTLRLKSSGIFGIIWRRADNHALSSLTCAAGFLS